MSYLKFQIHTSAKWRDILLALLSQLPFESFEEREAGLDAYIANNVDRVVVETALQELQKTYPFEYSVSSLPDKNWNELWESNFHPIRVGDFCGVRAGFHPPLEGVSHELIINPKMAFGTGHHATTYMMIQMMEGCAFRGTAVLDFGCGTGLLAILAARLGARSVLAVDIEADAYENTLENVRINGVESQVKVRQGGLDAAGGQVFDIILANINRNVILASLPALYTRLSERGILLVSGILKTDEQRLLRAAQRAGFVYHSKLEQEEWIGLKFNKP